MNAGVNVIVKVVTPVTTTVKPSPLTMAPSELIVPLMMLSGCMDGVAWVMIRFLFILNSGRMF